MRSHRATPGLLVPLFLLSACGAGATAGAGAESPPAPAGGAAGICSTDDPDCVDADLGGDDVPLDDLVFDLDAARRDARSLLGQSEEEVLALWGDVRVGRHGDEQMMLTEDLQPGRKTIATEDDGTGTYRVVEVVLETEGAPETFTAG